MRDGANISFVRLARKFFRSDLWNEPREFSRAEAWLDMIATATFAPETRLVEGRCVSLQRGELVASLRYLAKRWSWSKSKVERFLGTLVDAERATKRDANGTGVSVIMLCNYDAYNSSRDTIGTGTSPPTGTSAGQQRDKVQEEEEEKNSGERVIAQRPTLEQVKLRCQMRGHPEAQAEAFWNHFEASGWIDKNGHRIVAWEPKMETWMANARAKPAEQAHHGNRNGGISPSTQAILDTKKLERIEKRIKDIRDSVEGHQTMNDFDRDELRELKKQGRELKKALGMPV